MVWKLWETYMAQVELFLALQIIWTARALWQLLVETFAKAHIHLGGHGIVDMYV